MVLTYACRLSGGKAQQKQWWHLLALERAASLDLMLKPDSSYVPGTFQAAVLSLELPMNICK